MRREESENAVSSVSQLTEDGHSDKMHGISTIALVCVSIILAISTVISILFIKFSEDINKNLENRIENPVDKIIKSIIKGSLDMYIPTRFSVSPSFVLPPSDQMSRGTCWAFATIFMLESQYRGQGIAKGYLREDEYVLFSKQAYGALIMNECRKQNYSSGVCRHGGPLLNTTDDHLIPSLYYFIKEFPNFTHSILPESVCPYIPTDSPDNDYKCDGMYEAIETNPIQFKIKSMETAHDIRSAKRLLVKSQRPLGLSFPIADLVYYAPCDNSNYSNTDACLKDSVPCPLKGGYTSEKCAKIFISGMMGADGTFTFLEDVERVSMDGAHEINIVGYNDDWVYKNRNIGHRTLPNMKGGFITHNSWRSNGHSVDYYMGRLSEENEAVICPNHRLSSNWIPATFDCIVANEGDVTKCGKEYERVRGKGMAKHTDKLKCVNQKYCDTGRFYAIEYSAPLATGFDQTHVISWKNTNNANELDVKREVFDFFPFYALNQMLQPIEIVENDENQCGYWVVPYGTIDMVKKSTWDLLDTFYVADIELQFEDSSFARSYESKQYNTSLLLNSTHIFDKLDFDGPLPYKYVYN